MGEELEQDDVSILLLAAFCEPTRPDPFFLWKATSGIVLKGDAAFEDGMGRVRRPRKRGVVRRARSKRCPGWIGGLKPGRSKICLGRPGCPDVMMVMGPICWVDSVTVFWVLVSLEERGHLDL